MAHPLSGADLGTLRRAFHQGGRPDHWGKAVGIWGAALARAPISTIEHLMIKSKLPKTKDLPPPIFILGHWRSGTTHLYNTMVHGGFGYVPPVAVGLPWDMFGIARAFGPLLEKALPEHRWIDKIPVTPTSPQEDEIGIASMSDLSFYHGIYFPKEFDRLIDRGLFFDDCSADEIAGWEDRFTLFLCKLAHLQGLPLLIKNPVYTGRVAQLRRLFPEAKFIHIHRNPFDVFLSMRNFYAKLLDVMALQEIPSDLDIDATILRVYGRMMDAFQTETRGLKAPNFVELAYQTLDEDPVGALKHIYETLDLQGFDMAQPAFRTYLDSVKSYSKNWFKGDQRAIDKVSGAWSRWIDNWGYDVPQPAQP